MKYDNLMIDIETLGDLPGSAMLNVAAVPFNFNGDIGPEFMASITMESALKIGGTTNSTLIWWLEKDPALLLKTLLEGNISTLEALESLHGFVTENCNEHVKVWANGPDFDLKILEDKIVKCDLYKWWLPWNQRCVRTIKSIDLTLAKSFVNLEKHNPVEDCKVQIKQVLAIYEKYNLNIC